MRLEFGEATKKTDFQWPEIWIASNNTFLNIRTYNAIILNLWNWGEDKPYL